MSFYSRQSFSASFFHVSLGLPAPPPPPPPPAFNLYIICCSDCTTRTLHMPKPASHNQSMVKNKRKNVSVVRNHTDCFIRLLIICQIAAKKIVTFHPKTSSHNAVSTLSQLALFTPVVVSACGIWRWNRESLVCQGFRLEKKDWHLSSTKIFPYALI